MLRQHSVFEHQSSEHIGSTDKSSEGKWRKVKESEWKVKGSEGKWIGNNLESRIWQTTKIEVKYGHLWFREIFWFRSSGERWDHLIAKADAGELPKLYFQSCKLETGREDSQKRSSLYQPILSILSVAPFRQSYQPTRSTDSINRFDQPKPLSTRIPVLRSA